MDKPGSAGISALWATEKRLRWLLMVLTMMIYTLLCIARNPATEIWDEGRYMKYSHRLNHGYYVNPGDPDFVNGPGYPIVLMPFSDIGPMGWRLARLLNSFFMAGAVGFLWAAVRHYAGVRWATAAALALGLHPTLVWMGFSIMTEPLATFCISGFVWSFCRALRTAGGEARKWTIAATLFLGWLVLTRVFFGHVISATAILCLVLLPFLPAWRPYLHRTLLIMAGAFLMCVPYLLHTWQKTGEVLCWSTNSGELLYWMTSSHEGENGHWFSTEDTQSVPELIDKHAEIYQRTMKLPVLEREAAFKYMASQHLRDNPAGVAYNWVCNISRLAFGFPRSHQEEELRTVVLIATNGPLIACALLAGFLACRYWRSVPPEIWLLQAFIAFYLGGSTLAPALPRYFVICIPVLLLGIAVIFHRHLRIRIQSATSPAS